MLTLALVSILLFQERLSRIDFIALALLNSIPLAATNSDWLKFVVSGLETAAFIGTFFAALSTLRNVAETYPAIQWADTFLASQPLGFAGAKSSRTKSMIALVNF